MAEGSGGRDGREREGQARRREAKGSQQHGFGGQPHGEGRPHGEDPPRGAGRRQRERRAHPGGAAGGAAAGVAAGAELAITEIRVKLTDDPRNKLRAYCSVTIDDAIVVRDLKIIEGSKGPFVAMPSRKLADHCPRCGHKNHLRANYCNQCGAELDPDRAPRDERGRARLHADLAHPINSKTRIELHKAVVRAYVDEVEAMRAAGADYRPKSFDDLDYLADGIDVDYLEELERRREARERRRRAARHAEQGMATVEPEDAGNPEDGDDAATSAARQPVDRSGGGGPRPGRRSEGADL